MPKCEVYTPPPYPAPLVATLAPPPHLRGDAINRSLVLSATVRHAKHEYALPRCRRRCRHPASSPLLIPFLLLIIHSLRPKRPRVVVHPQPVAGDERPRREGDLVAVGGRDRLGSATAGGLFCPAAPGKLPEASAFLERRRGATGQHDRGREGCEGRVALGRGGGGESVACRARGMMIWLL